ncbi:hypothetical protein ABFS82_10G007800 [Erythranthe guttata]|uniref:pentatricopeptide repeat-containing protein At2g38420, mitochondrial n=1 Tax=Erythranthe guttata TaxID=4155 RepID=UPI00064D8897|nr:PREDICTED: pentatricopeptide repeat-containing protein At2g38420, mitochondrial [Erythranthe guttata]|eukprot:XP_012831789.1 PREDICTED: pentatricopeptide repeat-containing protein At2g38420, mitochondrial [Erythranthe guttata]
MLRGVVAHCKRFITHQWRQQINPNYSLFISTSTASFSSRKSSSLHNYYIRKRRKWPIQPFTTHRCESFAVKLAKQLFKQSIRKSKINLLSDLIKSCVAYEIEPTPQSYHLLFKILIQQKPSNCREQIRQILDHIEKVETFQTPERVFIDLINFYGDNSMFDDAVDLFFRTPSYRCDSSVEILNALLSILCRGKRGVDMVPQILMKTQAMNIRIEESSFRILIRTLCKIGSVSNALELLTHMVDEGFDLDQKNCSLMLATMCWQLNCDSGKIMASFEDLKMLGFAPRKNDFCNLIRFLIAKGKGKEAFGLLKQMKTSRLKPDIMCYNLVLDGLVENGEFTSADKVFDELLVLGLAPDIYTYNVYIKGLCVQKKLEDGIKLMCAMKALGCSPDLCTYSTILRALCKAGEFDRVTEVVTEMRQKSMQLNPKIYDILVDGFIANGDVNGARCLLDEMLNENLVPQQTTLDKVTGCDPRMLSQVQD